MTVAEYVSSALLRSVKPGSDNITMQAGTLNQVLKKDTAARLSQQLVTFPRSDGVAISFKLPTLENVTSATDVMGLQVCFIMGHKSRQPSCWFYVLWCVQLVGRKCIISSTIALKRESLGSPTD